MAWNITRDASAKFDFEIFFTFRTLSASIPLGIGFYRDTKLYVVHHVELDYLWRRGEAANP